MQARVTAVDGVNEDEATESVALTYTPGNKKAKEQVVQIAAFRKASPDNITLQSVACCRCCSCSCRKCSRKLIAGALGFMAILWIVTIACGLGFGLQQDGSDQSPEPTRRRAVGAVAADHTACSEVGRDTLARGGSAIDAAIAALLCVGVRQPHSMGIGGGLFMAVYDRNSKTVKVYDGREVAPAAATFDRYFNQSLSMGPLSIAVPGEIPTYWAAHKNHGRLPWRDLFQPAIRMAADGHPLSQSTARALRIMRENGTGDLLSTYTGLCALFCKPDGTAKEAGDIVRYPVLAKTLEGIAENGPDYLYSPLSPAAVQLIQDIKDMGGLVTMADLQKYKVDTHTPISIALGDDTLYTLSAPSGGPVLGLVLKVLQDFNFSHDDLTSAKTTAAMIHKIVETFKFAYADRQKLGDPFFTNVTQLLSKMTSSEYARRIYDAIDPQQTYNTTHYTDIAGTPWKEGGTTHISVIGPGGDAVSASSTINQYFGSLLVSPSTGIILNNEMSDFRRPDGPVLDRLKQQSPNFIEPGKRPLSSMAPAIIVDKGGSPRLVLGSAGGAQITTTNAQVIARVLWMKQTLEDAITAKRFHHQLFPNQLYWEYDFPKELLELLGSYGHQLVERKVYMAVVQAVAQDSQTGEITAFSDLRKNAEARLLYS